jgi:hypothetical protein|tara:strand:+ start:1751 stop:2113 length:363 start_codon:yes stop_codon:yes gene_type:complete
MRNNFITATICASILVSCSSNSFTPSESFNTQPLEEYTSTESILRVSQALDLNDDTQGFTIKAWRASSDENLVLDLKSEPMNIELDPSQQKIDILSKSTHNDKNYFLINLKEEQYVWIQY